MITITLISCVRNDGQRKKRNCQIVWRVRFVNWTTIKSNHGQRKKRNCQIVWRVSSWIEPRSPLIVHSWYWRRKDSISPHRNVINSEHDTLGISRHAGVLLWGWLSYWPAPLLAVLLAPPRGRVCLPAALKADKSSRSDIEENALLVLSYFPIDHLLPRLYVIEISRNPASWIQPRCF